MNAIEISSAAAPSNTVAPVPQPATRSRLWVWFAVAFLVQVGVWSAWFVIAAHNKVEEVPVTAVGAKL